jgi:PAS domain S-box-containing protein
VTANYQQQLEALNKLSQAILSNIDLAKMERLLVKEIQSIFGGIGCMLFSPDGRGFLIPRAYTRTHRVSVEAEKAKIDDGLAGKVWKTRRASYSNDIVGDRVFRGRPHPMASRLNVTKLLSAPLLVDGEPIRVLSVARTPKHPDFTDLDLELLASFCNQAAIAIKNASTYQALEREQKALEESEERYRRVFEDSPIGLYRTTPDGRILMANPALLNMLKYSSLEELSRRNLEKSGYEPGNPRSTFKNLIESKGEVVGLESAWIRTDGSTVYVRESARAIRDDRGKTLYYEGTVEDITLQRLLNEISKTVSSSLDLDEVLKSVLRETLKALGFKGAALYLYNSKTRRLEVSSTYGMEYPEVDRIKADLIKTLEEVPLPIGQSLAGQAFKQGKVISYDESSSKHRKRVHGIVRQFGLKALTHIPVVAAGETIGTIAVVSDEKIRLDPFRERLAYAIGNQVGIAIRNAATYQNLKEAHGELLEKEKQLRRSNSESKLLNDISRIVNSTLDLDQVLKSVMQETVKALGFRHAVIFSHNPREDTLELTSTFRAAKAAIEKFKRIKVHLDESLAGRSFKTGKVIFFDSSNPRAKKRVHKIFHELRLRVALYIPVRAKDEKVGLLALFSRVPVRFDLSSERIATAIGHQVGMAIKNAAAHQALKREEEAIQTSNRELLQKEKELAQSNEELKLLNDISSIVSGSLDLDEVLTRIMRESCKAFGFQTAGIFLYNPERKRLEISSTFNVPKGVDEKLKTAHLYIQQGLAGQSFKSGKTLSYAKLGSEERKKARARFMDPQVRALTCIPVMAKGEKIGVLALVSRKEVSSGPFLERIASAIGNQVGIAIENASIHQALQKRQQALEQGNRELLQKDKELAQSNEELKLLNDISSIVTGSLDLDEVLTRIMRETCRVLGFQAANIYFRYPKARALELRASYNIPEPLVRKIRSSLLDIDHSLAGRSFRTGKVVSYRRLRSDQKKHVHELFYTLGIKEFIHVPVTAPGGRIGVLTLASRKEVELDPSQESLAAAIGNQVGMAIENAKLYQDTRQQAENLTDWNKRLSTLLRITRAAVESADLNGFFGKITRLVAQVFEADRCYVVRLDESGDFAVVKAPYSGQPNPFPPAGQRIPLADFPLLSAVCLGGETRAITPDILDTTLEQNHVSQAGIKSGTAVPLSCEKRVLGALIVTHTRAEREYSEEDISFLAAISNQTATAIKKFELAQEVEEKRRNLERLSSEMIRLEEKQRQTVAGELHDSVGQSLTALRINLDFTEGLIPSEQEELKSRIRQTSELVANTMQEIRDIEQNLRPRVLDDLGLISALRWFTKSFSQQVSIPVSFKSHGSIRRLTPDLQITIYRIAQEGLSNIAKHSKATQASVDLKVEGAVCVLQLEDNGIGFDSAKAQRSTDSKKAFGIFNIRERVSLLGGKLEILSDKGEGTTLRVTIPVREGGSR